MTTIERPRWQRPRPRPRLRPAPAATAVQLRSMWPIWSGAADREGLTGTASVTAASVVPVVACSDNNFTSTSTSTSTSSSSNSQSVVLSVPPKQHHLLQLLLLLFFLSLPTAFFIHFIAHFFHINDKLGSIYRRFNTSPFLCLFLTLARVSHQVFFSLTSTLLVFKNANW